jgi:hypothetical protein
MLSTVLTGALLFQAKPELTSPEIISVSMFKNGFAFVTRRIKLKDGAANVVEVPQASLGTLWFWTPEGELKRIYTNESASKTKQEVNLASFDQLVRANVGKQVYVESQSAAPQDGKIKSADGDLLILETQSGITAIRKDTIKYLKTSDEKFSWKQTVETETKEKFYTIEADRKTKEIMMMSLERGVSWAPGYAVDITKEGTLTVASKATVMNDLLPLDNVPVRLITGFPNLQFKDILDPFTSGMSNDTWLGTLSTGGMPGGFGGSGRGRANEMMAQNAYAPAMKSSDVNWGGSDAAQVGGEQIGDLFFYDLEKFSSKRNSRIYQNLFKFESKYEHIYTWDIDDRVDASGNYRPTPANQQDAEEIWHTVKFKNGSGKPLTTGAATIFNKGELIGQTMMNYIPSGGEVSIRINKALDVRPEANEEEVSRERAAIRDQYNNPRWDLVTVKGTLEITNSRKDEVQLNLVKQFTGELVKADGEPALVKTTKGLRQMNSTGKLTWKPKVKSGECLHLEYTYKLYVPAQ